MTIKEQLETPQNKNDLANMYEKAKDEIRRVFDQIPRISSNSKEDDLITLKDFFKDTIKKLDIINNSIKTVENSGKEAIPLITREIETAVNFFKDITSYEAFAQIPLLLRDNKTSGEMYVMKRKGGKKGIDKEDFTLFLSLGTINLGKVDAFVHVKKKNVMLRVMVNEKSYFENFKKDFINLYNALKDKGYLLSDIKYSLRDEGLNILNADELHNSLFPRKNRIDYRL